MRQDTREYNEMLIRVIADDTEGKNPCYLFEEDEGLSAGKMTEITIK